MRFTSAWTSYSKLKNSTSFSTQISSFVKLKLDDSSLRETRAQWNLNYSLILRPKLYKLTIKLELKLENDDFRTPTKHLSIFPDSLEPNCLSKWCLGSKNRPYTQWGGRSLRSRKSPLGPPPLPITSIKLLEAGCNLLLAWNLMVEGKLTLRNLIQCCKIRHAFKRFQLT